MSGLQIFDTQTREKVPFEPIEEGRVRMYNCGPTIYNFAHIGNFRAYVFADMLRRWFDVAGYDVQQVMNLTDVDDKTIRKSREEEVPLSKITDYYRDAFFKDLDSLEIRRADEYPAATDHVAEMVELVERLIEKGHAYRAEDGSIYFRIASYPEYGSLSGKRLEDLRLGERVSSDEYESKDDVHDFALWKAWDEEDGDVFWETSLGKGRPGWHIECSAMSMKYLGETFDIHTGGVDNIFPHHENEIAQSRCATDGQFSRHWMHCEYLVVEGKKMSKSLGNFFTLRDLLDKGYRARAIRYVLIATHYRSRLNFTLEGLDAAWKSLGRLDEFRESWSGYRDGDTTEDVAEAVTRADREFTEAMNDDLNVSNALAAVFGLVREVNALATKGVPTAGDAKALENLWLRWDDALGILHPFEDEKALEADVDEGWIEEMIEARAEARRQKDFGRADAIRDELAEKGIILKDSPEGTTWKRA